jgi:hypothetical protein
MLTVSCFSHFAFVCFSLPDNLKSLLNSSHWIPCNVSCPEHFAFGICLKRTFVHNKKEKQQQQSQSGSRFPQSHKPIVGTSRQQIQVWVVRHGQHFSCVNLHSVFHSSSRHGERIQNGVFCDSIQELSLWRNNAVNQNSSFVFLTDKLSHHLQIIVGE